MPFPRSCVHAVSLLVLAVATHPARVHAQEPKTKRYTLIAGVGDVDTGAPLEGADVRVLDAGRNATTNALGEARVNGIPAGTHRVQVRMIGYQPLETMVVFPQGASDTVQAVFMPRRGKLLLDTVVVAEKRVPRYLAPFERRRLQKQGQYLTDADLAKADHWGFTDMLRQKLFDIRVAKSRDGFGKQLMVRNGSEFCRGAVYLDDVRVWGGDISGIHPEDLAGVEVYDRTHTPIAYRQQGADCGVMLLWSKQTP